MADYRDSGLEQGRLKGVEAGIGKTVDEEGQDGDNGRGTGEGGEQWPLSIVGRGVGIEADDAEQLGGVGKQAMGGVAGGVGGQRRR